jgi:signal transduction histidine kinase
MLTIFVILAVFLQILIALSVYFRRSNSPANTVFMLLNFALAGWAAASYAGVAFEPNSNTIYFVRTVITLVIIQNTLFYLFARMFPGGKIKNLPKRSKYLLIFSLLLIIISQTPLLFESVTIQDGAARPTPGSAIILFILHALITVSRGMTSLVKKYKRAVSEQKSQLLIILIASTVLWIVVPITNFAVTLSANTNFFVVISPFYTLLFSLLLSYAIIRHRLFNIRLIVARSLGYVLSLSILVLIYTSLTQILFQFFANMGSFYLSLLANILLLIFITLTYQPLKNFFDKQTHRVFYRDAYDPQAFLDQLNKTLVGNIEIGILLRHTTAVIAENLKANCSIYVKETSTADARMIGNTKFDIKPKQLALIKSELAAIGEKTVVTDELIDSRYLELKNALYINNIAVITSLVTSYSMSQEATAYLMMSPKKSGNAYSSQDIKIINLITDELLIAIQNALRFEEIQDFNITLQKRISDATAKLKRGNLKLKEMDETKDEFISMASHQLRTPLTSVKGYLSMVLEGDAGKISPTQRQLLNQAFVSSQRMAFLIADLLNVSRLKTGKFIIDAAPTNLANMVESELDQLKEVAKGRKLTLSFDKPANFPELMLDETKTRQVVMNFVDNAIYYTPSGGRIKIELRSDRSNIYFMVKDNGIGIPKNEQSQLFSKFYRASNAQRARPDGTGLGLFMAKKVINDQGGALLFESAEDKGSTFGFKFEKPRDKK